MIWRVHCAKKVRIFVWELSHKSLNTHDKDPKVPPMCFCHCGVLFARKNQKLKTISFSTALLLWSFLLYTFYWHFTLPKAHWHKHPSPMILVGHPIKKTRRFYVRAFFCTFCLERNIKSFNNKEKKYFDWFVESFTLFALSWWKLWVHALTLFLANWKNFLYLPSAWYSAFFLLFYNFISSMKLFCQKEIKILI